MTDNVNGGMPRKKIKNRRVKAPLAAPPTVISKKVIPSKEAMDASIEWGASVVIYARFSSPGQSDGLSIEGQKRSANNYAREQGWRIARVFADEGISGATLNRAQLRALFAYLRKHPGTIVLIARASRMARETDVYHEIKKETKNLRCRLIFVNIGDVGEDQVAGEMVSAQKNRHELVVGMRNGKIEHAYEGKIISKHRYGYFMGVDNRAHPDWKGAASTVKRIFEERRDGHSLKQIAHGLNLDDINPPAVERGEEQIGEWTDMKVHCVLKEKKYIGILEQSTHVYPWERFGKYFDVERETIEIEAPWMRIVSDELFYARKGQVPDRPKGSKGPSDPYILSSKVEDPSCNHTMYPLNRRGHYVMRCRHNSVGVECPEVRYAYPIFETMALEVAESVMGLHAETAFSDRMMELLRADYDRLHKKAHERQQLIDDLEERVQAAAAAFSEGAKEARRRGEDLGDFLLRARASSMEEAAELAGLKVGHVPVDEIQTFDDLYTDVKKTMRDALKVLKAQVPFRPKGDPTGRALVSVVSELFRKVTMVKRSFGRFDVTYHVSGAAWGSPDVTIERTFEDVLVYDSLARKDLAKTNLAADVEAKNLYPDKAFLVSLQPLEVCELRLGGWLKDGVFAVILSVKFGITLRKASEGVGLNSHQFVVLRTYLRTKDGVRLHQRISEILSIPIREYNYGKKGFVRTMRERWIEDRHPLLRYALADATTGVTRIPDRDWDALIADGIAADKKSLVGRQGKDDRLALEALMYVVRENERMEQLPDGYCKATMMQRLVRHIDGSGLVGRLTVCLLAAQGARDLPEPEQVPPLRNSETVHVNKRGPNAPKTYDVTKVKPGRRPAMGIRLAALAEYNAKKGKETKNAD
tara:strand:- start:10720 stop:13332 length:2613 start_codon:yes stop_codon:yes gene_type:complete